MSRTASVLLSEREVEALGGGLRMFYRPTSKHWDGQFGKFLEPRQIALVGFEESDIVHLMKETGRHHEDGRPIVVKIGARVVRRITNRAVFPEGFSIDYPLLEPGDPCWCMVLGHKL